ncbi:FAD-dependent monooxygenase [Actinoplanes sp. TFC3]|uniref:FAD-dependent monooxygenase n=1 Tax=Actinoplanes sp. TFC3 TaxID=1710355 RepID=UPI0008317F7E|nr:FAD-dependent monooxygenase [Actinoplanes sp. TFC3]
MDVIIAGAGPTGLTLAIELQRRGVAHRIVEASPHPFEGSRGKGLQPRTLEALDDLGVLDRFLAAGADYPPLRIHRPDGQQVDWRMDELHEPTPDVPHPNALMVPQFRTGQLLADRLTELGGTVEYGVSVTTFSQDAHGVHVTLSTGETVTTHYLAGADGGRSTVRAQLGVGFEGETFETQTMLVADVRLTGLSRDAWHIWPGPDGRSQKLGLCPLPGTDLWQLTAPDATSVTDALAEVAPQVTFQDVGWRSMYRANMRMVDRFRVGNVFLAGDAAHVHSPAGGQGLNTGVQDAYNLGWKLASGDDKLLDTYEEERLPVAAAVLGISSRLHKRHSEDPETALRRDDPVLRQLSLNYRGSSLAVDHRAEPGRVRAGDRAPDAPGNGRRVFDLLRGPHWTLLAVDAPAPTVPGVDSFTIDAHDIYDVQKPTYFLVRPDNYIARVTEDPADLATFVP